MTKVHRPRNTQGLKTICKSLMIGLTPSNEIGPSDIMPCFSMSCAAALVITVNNMKAMYFISPPIPVTRLR